MTKRKTAVLRGFKVFSLFLFLALIADVQLAMGVYLDKKVIQKQLTLDSSKFVADEDWAYSYYKYLLAQDSAEPLADPLKEDLVFQAYLKPENERFRAVYYNYFLESIEKDIHTKEELGEADKRDLSHLVLKINEYLEKDPFYATHALLNPGLRSQDYRMRNLFVAAYQRAQANCLSRGEKTREERVAQLEYLNAIRECEDEKGPRPYDDNFHYKQLQLYPERSPFPRQEKHQEKYEDERKQPEPRQDLEIEKVKCNPPIESNPIGGFFGFFNSIQKAVSNQIYGDEAYRARKALQREAFEKDRLVQLDAILSTFKKDQKTIQEDMDLIDNMKFGMSLCGLSGNKSFFEECYIKFRKESETTFSKLGSYRAKVNDLSKKARDLVSSSPSLERRERASQILVQAKDAALFIRRKTRKLMELRGQFDRIRPLVNRGGGSKFFSSLNVRNGNSDAQAVKKEVTDLLHISNHSSHSEIKAAYKSLVRQLHPGHGGSEEGFIKLNTAMDAYRRFYGNTAHTWFD